MNTRQKIIEAVAANKPAFIPAPASVLNVAVESDADLQSKFITVLETIGGRTIVTTDYKLIGDLLDAERSIGRHVINTVPEIGIDHTLTSDQNALALEKVYLACIPGTIGVAENGAVWVDESQMVNRLLPFICQHLVIVLDARKIVVDMHEAYSTIKIDQAGYGVFIAGPSKTADIEQSLVIGAHGARSLTVYLVK